MCHLVFSVLLTAIVTVSYGQSSIQEIVLEEPYYFEEGSTTFRIGLGLGSNLNLDSISTALYGIETEISIPALMLNYERQAYRNIGVGVNLGYQKWTAPEFEYDYHYVSAGLLGKYHFNFTFLEELDPYIGVGAQYRRFSMTNSSDLSIRNSAFDYTAMVGLSYYFESVVGAFVEVGNLGQSLATVGISFYFQ